MKKQKKIAILKPATCPYWRYSCADGEVAIYIPEGDKLTVERANILLDRAKQSLLKD